jgi:glycine cleavage system H protein
MSPPLVFSMGRSPAILPTDRRYARNHMWAMPCAGGLRFGLSAYAVKLFGDVHTLQWSVQPGEMLEPGIPIGYLEGSKATSDLYAPASGELLSLNGAVLADRSLLNSNPYDAGWLLEIAAADAFLSPDEYLAHLEAVWPLAQRLLKGQAGARGEA